MSAGGGCSWEIWEEEEGKLIEAKLYVFLGLLWGNRSLTVFFPYFTPEIMWSATPALHVPRNLFICDKNRFVHITLLRNNPGGGTASRKLWRSRAFVIVLFAYIFKHLQCRYLQVNGSFCVQTTCKLCLVMTLFMTVIELIRARRHGGDVLGKRH